MWTLPGINLGVTHSRSRTSLSFGWSLFQSHALRPLRRVGPSRHLSRSACQRRAAFANMRRRTGGQWLQLFTTIPVFVLFVSEETESCQPAAFVLEQGSESISVQTRSDAWMKCPHSGRPEPDLMDLLHKNPFNFAAAAGNLCFCRSV